MKTCDYCGTDNEEALTNCYQCDQPLPGIVKTVETIDHGQRLEIQRTREFKVKICSNCGAENLDFARFCSQCGLRLTGETETRMGSVYVEYAGFWRRLVASIIDSIIMYIILIPMAFTLTTAYYYGLGQLVVVLFIIGFWSWRSQTPGKMVMGVSIVDAEGKPITFGRSLLRYFGYIVSSIPLNLGFLWIAWDKKKQGWHDKIAGTYVIRD